MAAAFPARTGGGAARHRPRRVRPLRPAAVRAAEVQHAVAGGDAGAGRVRRRRARPRRPTRRARACCSSPGTSGSGSCRRWSTRCGSQPMAVLARALDNPALNAAARAHPHAHRQHRHLPAGHDPAGAAACCRPGDGVGDPDRSAHPEPRRDLRRLLRSARRRRRRRSRRWRCAPARRSCRCSRCRSAAGAIG